MLPKPLVRNVGSKIPISVDTETDVIEPDLTYKAAMNLDHPSMRMIDKPLNSSHHTVPCQRTSSGPAHSKNLDYVCMITQRMACFHVIGGSLPELKIFPSNMAAIVAQYVNFPEVGHRITGDRTG